MRFTADIDGTAIDRFRSLEPDRVPIPAIHQRDDGDWYVTVAHLETVVTALLADGLSVTVTPVIEARDLPTDVRPADAPPLPWHTDSATPRTSLGAKRPQCVSREPCDMILVGRQPVRVIPWTQDLPVAWLTIPTYQEIINRKDLYT